MSSDNNEVKTEAYYRDKFEKLKKEVLQYIKNGKNYLLKQKFKELLNNFEKNDGSITEAEEKKILKYIYDNNYDRTIEISKESLDLRNWWSVLWRKIIYFFFQI